jgi:hypothetical protein
LVLLSTIISTKIIWRQTPHFLELCVSVVVVVAVAGGGGGWWCDGGSVDL